MTLSPAQKTALITAILDSVDPHHRPWLQEYFEVNIDDIVTSVYQGDTFRHGFRGMEVREQMIRMGLYTPRVIDSRLAQI